jgi:hypothetical protein
MMMNSSDNNIRLFLLAVLIAMVASPSVTLKSQETKGLIFPYGVTCDMPHNIQADSRFTVIFNIRKEVGYVGPMTIIQELPTGFQMISDTIPYATVSFDNKKFKIFWKHLPLGETFSFEADFAVENISQAVYPFSGSALFFHLNIPYSGFVKISSNTNRINAPTQEGHLAPLAIYFEVPGRITPDHEFTFVTVVNKESDYVAPGKISQKWPGVFIPKPTHLKNARFSIGDDNTVEISWDELENGNYFSIAYQVFTKKTASGVYAVLTDYSDAQGLKLTESKGIHIVNDQEPEPIPVPVPEPTTGLYQIRFEHPTEVIGGESFNISVFIQKGKNTQPGDLRLTFPSGCRVDVSGDWQTTYNPGSGRLEIVWEHLPSAPVVEVSATVNTSGVAKAGYMIEAAFSINGRQKAINTSHLLISDSKKLAELHTTEQKTAADDNKAKTDRMFSKIDSLLYRWADSVSGNQKPASADTTDEQINYRVQILASNKVLPNVRRLLVSMGIRLPMNVYYDGEYYKYTLGTFISRAKASEYMRFVKGRGFADAFVVEYTGDKPTSDR